MALTWCHCPAFSTKQGGAKNTKRTQGEGALDERRIKFLERNRAAATRCREKKKQWLQELQQKAATLTTSNRQLNDELRRLRDEVAQLKNNVVRTKVNGAWLLRHSLGDGLGGPHGTAF